MIVNIDEATEYVDHWLYYAKFLMQRERLASDGTSQILVFMRMKGMMGIVSFAIGHGHNFMRVRGSWLV